MNSTYNKTMSEVINIKELNERIERESVFVDTLRTEMGKVIVGQSHLVDTLLIGLLTIMLFDAVVKKQEWHPVLRSALLVIITFGGMGAAYLLHTDYDAKGVLAILVFYMTRQMRGLQIVAGCLAFCWELPAIVAFIPIAFYNGKRGWNIKYLFYAFYPVHLLVLYLICVGMGTAQIAVV